MSGAQLHLLTNHLPVLAVPFAAAVTASGVILKNETLRKAGLWAFFIAAVSALPAYYSGEGAEEAVEHLPGVLKSLIHKHEEAAERALIATMLMGAAALASAGWALRTKAGVERPALAVLAFSLPVMGMLAWAAHLGGQVRHTELRAGGAAGHESSGISDKDTDR